MPSALIIIRGPCPTPARGAVIASAAHAELMQHTCSPERLAPPQVASVEAAVLPGDAGVEFARLACTALHLTSPPRLRATRKCNVTHMQSLKAACAYASLYYL